MADYFDIPPGIESLEELRAAVNDRLQRIHATSSGALKLTGDLDAAGFEIRNLGKPTSLNGAATLADVRRSSRPASAAVIPQAEVQLGLAGIAYPSRR